MKITIYPKIIPIFPLPNVVFFPNTYLPLHIFEPRYREMVRDAEKKDGIIGMILLKEGWEKDYYDNPEVFSAGCAGQMVSVQPLEDGRFNIVLKGLFRFEINDQFFDKSYRQAVIDPFPQDKKGGKLPSKLKEDMIHLLNNYARRVKGGNQVLALLEAVIDDETFLHTLCFGLQFTPLEKQFLLESTDYAQQAKRLMELIQFQILEIRKPSPPEEGAV